MQDDRTPLHYAAENGGVDVVKLLIREGAAVDAVTQVIIFNAPSCWQCDSAFGMTVCHAVCHIHHKRHACAATGQHEYGFWWMVGSKEQYSVQPPMFVILGQVG